MPELVFGAAALAMSYGLPRAGRGANPALTSTQSAKLVERALELGVTTFDTAPAYTGSEQRLGEVLRGRGKVWTKVATGDPSASLDASLARLQRGHVELLQWHNWTASLGRDEAWIANWARLRGDRRVLALGATTYGVADAVAAADSGLFDVVQCEANLLNQSVVTALAGRAVAVAIRSVYLQGALTDEGRELPLLPALQSAVDRARELARATGLTRLALRSVLERPGVAYVLVGIDRVEQLDEAVAIANGEPLPPEVRARITTLDLGGDPVCDPRTWPRA